MRNRLFYLCLGLAILLCALRLTLWQGANPEYDYTVRQLFRFLFFPLTLAAFLLSPSRVGWLAKICIGLALLFIAIPCVAPPVTLLPWRQQYLLSGCWILGSLGVAIGLFALAARLKGSLPGILCLAGSLSFAFCAGEIYFLATDQAQDGIVNDSRHSKYASLPYLGDYGSNIVTGKSGDFPVGKGSPYAEANRQLKFDDEMYDVLYGFDEKGRRITPEASAHPLYQLMLFGCSYTFGYGLNDEETWAWNLAKDLGPQWKLENYAYNGFGPQQMLSLIEDGAVENTDAPHKAAVFLALEDQLRRNAGLIYKNSIHYALDSSGKPVRDGWTTDLFISKICAIPKYLNGSQLARYLSLGLILGVARKDHVEHVKTWQAIIKESSDLLKKRYDARLVVLLWPDVEYLKPELEDRKSVV